MPVMSCVFFDKSPSIVLWSFTIDTLNQSQRIAQRRPVEKSEAVWGASIAKRGELKKNQWNTALYNIIIEAKHLIIDYYCILIVFIIYIYNCIIYIYMDHLQAVKSNLTSVASVPSKECPFKRWDIYGYLWIFHPFLWVICSLRDSGTVWMDENSERWSQDLDGISADLDSPGLGKWDMW